MVNNASSGYIQHPKRPPYRSLTSVFCHYFINKNTGKFVYTGVILNEFEINKGCFIFRIIGYARLGCFMICRRIMLGSFI